MDDLSGKKLGEYQIIKLLRQGGMASVYSAYHPRTERELAVKVLSKSISSDVAHRERFRREMTILMKLNHTNIVSVIDIVETEADYYLVMQLMQEGSLAEEITTKPLPWRTVRQVITQVGSALHYAHQQGVVHRDVKPANILRDPAGNYLLTDFGIARVLESGDQSLTQQGASIGTVRYMAPEQCLGEEVDHRADIYALGIMLYEMVTGRLPFQGDSAAAVLAAHIHDKPASPRSLNGNIPQALEQVILKALEKDKSRRFQSVDEMVKAVLKILTDEFVSFGEQETRDVPVSVPSKSANVKRKKGFPLWLAIIPLLVILGVGALAALLLGRSLLTKADEQMTQATSVQTTVSVAMPAATQTTWVNETQPLSNNSLAPLITEKENLSNTPGNSEYPVLAVDYDDNLHLLWVDESSPGQSDFFHRTLTAEGSWMDAENLTDGEFSVLFDGNLLEKAQGELCAVMNATLSSGHCRLAEVCFGNGTAGSLNTLDLPLDFWMEIAPAYDPAGSLAYVFSDRGPSDLYYGDTLLSGGYQRVKEPRLLIDGNGRFHALWVFNEAPLDLAYRRSDDGGQTWTETEMLSDETKTGAMLSYDLVQTVNEEIQLVFRANGGLYYRQWDAQAGWSSITELAGGSSRILNPTLAADPDGETYLAYTIDNKIYYIELNEDTDLEQAALVYQEDSGQIDNLQLTVGMDGTKHIVWNPLVGSRDIYYVQFP